MSGPYDDANELERRGHELVARGHELLAKAAELRARDASDEWVPVASSPLGRRKTLALARAGAIASAKIGRKVLLRASSLREYIEQHCGPSHRRTKSSSASRLLVVKRRVRESDVRETAAHGAAATELSVGYAA